MATVAELRLAADRGDAKAQCSLGICYYTGKGVTQDYKEAARYYRLAADRGDADAQCALGSSYYNGKSVPQDWHAITAWLQIRAMALRNYVWVPVTTTAKVLLKTSRRRCAITAWPPPKDKQTPWMNCNSWGSRLHRRGPRVQRQQQRQQRHRPRPWCP
jgi:TPR repeat protein